MEALAEYTQHSPDGEAWVLTKIYPKYDSNGERVSRLVALGYSEMEEINNTTMGEVQAGPPVIYSTRSVWIIEQTFVANV
ncbi:MAG: hypothetical protein ACXABY_13155 [Candidatus Thorarchaeota archaeon]|jgi:hypothetical protein